MNSLVIRSLLIISFLSSLSSEEYLFPSNQVTVSSIQNGGVGYTDGYSSLDLFLMSKVASHYYLFVDGRFHLFNNGKNAWNLGMGGRSVSSWKPAAFGWNTFFDARNDKADFQRVSIGVDGSLDRLFFASNGYFLISDQAKVWDSLDFRYAAGYKLSDLFEEDAFRYSWDAEAGCFPLIAGGCRGYLGIGPYYLRNNNLFADLKNIWGLKARAFLELKQICHLEFVFTNDPLFGTKYQGKIAITFSWPWEGRSKSFMPVVRQEIIPTTFIDYWFWNW